MSRNKQAGFTIVELMIALTVLSLVLLLSTLTLSSLGKLFSKGVNQALTQNITRNLMDTIGSDIQYGSNKPQYKLNATTEILCMGSTRYAFLRAVPLSSTHPHVFWRDKLNTPDKCTTYDLAAIADPNTAPDAVSKSGVEMLNAGMAVTDLDAVTTDDTSWTIKVTVAFGDDLIVYDKPTDSTNCKSVKGNQFCAVASLKKSVTRRLSN